MSERYQLHRAGIVNVWQYDNQELRFEGGRLLLRGKNGAGKSKALETLLPFLLDGDARRMAADGGAKTSLRWLMTDGSPATNRIGYLWLELCRDDEYLTLGAAIKSSSTTGEARSAFFVTNSRIGIDIALVDGKQPLSLERMKEHVGEDSWFTTARDYRMRVAREVFGLVDEARYRNLLHMLYRLRQPTIGDKIEDGKLVDELSAALPPVDDDILDSAAHNLDDLDTVREELGRLERTHTALDTFLTAYRGYLRGTLRGRTHIVRDALDTLAERRKRAGGLERQLASLRAKQEAAQTALASLKEGGDRARAELYALRDSAEYKSVKDLSLHRDNVTALASAARSAEMSASTAQGQVRATAQSVADDTERIGRALGAVRTNHRALASIARSTGVEEAHFGEPPATATIPAPTDPSVLMINVDTTHAAVAEFDRALSAAKGVVTARDLVAKDLRGHIDKAASAANLAASKENAVGQAELSLEHAVGRREEQSGAVVTAGQEYVASARSWFESLADVDLAAANEFLSEIDDPGAPSGDVAAQVASAVRASAGVLRSTLDDQFGAADPELRRIRSDLKSAREEHEKWAGQRDPEPERSRFATAERDLSSGAPFYRLVDFADGVDPLAQAGLEAALESSGILDGWVAADGAVIDPDTRDIVLSSNGTQLRHSLASVLRPVDPTDTRTATLLASIGLGESDAKSWIGIDGRWRLGVASGAHVKDHAEYVGVASREALRARKLAELEITIGQLESEEETAVGILDAVASRRKDLDTALDAGPSGARLIRAWSAWAEAGVAVARAERDVDRARREAEDARAAAATLRREAEATATSYSLPSDRAALDAVLRDLARLTDGIGPLRASVNEIVERFGKHQDLVAAHADALEKAERSTIEAELEREKYELAAQRMSALEAAVGAQESEILARESDAQQRIREAAISVPIAERAYQGSHDDVVRTESERDNARIQLAEQETLAVQSGVGLRTVLAIPALVLAAGMSDMDDALTSFDELGESAVPKRIVALKNLADTVDGALGAARHDVGDTALLKRYDDLRASLAGGYDAAIDEHDGVKVVELHDDFGTHPIALVGARLAEEVEDKRGTLAARQQATFERFLLNELGTALSNQVFAAGELIASMNSVLKQVSTSHGLGARLEWKVSDDADADARVAVELLRSPMHLRSQEQNARLSQALQRLLETSRLEDPSAGYGAHLRKALDYRKWFTFTVKVTDSARPGNERTLSRRTALSQGEQRVVSYLVLFAAAAAHFSAVGDNHPIAPRMVLLDDAFAKVDEPTHARLLGLLVKLDLDFVITSERLWGTFPTVPSAGIYERLRDPVARGVATLHYTWDGSRKRMVPV